MTMTVELVIHSVSATGALLLGVLAVVRKWNAVASWCFLAGMAVLAVDATLGMRVLEASTPEGQASGLRWQWLAKSLLPGSWLCFSLLYCRGNAREFLWRWIADDSRIKTKSLSAHEAFIIFIKASLLAGVLISSPWIFYQIWSFVAAGLYPHERKYIHIFLPFSLALFLAGASLAFIFVFPPVLKFLFYFNSELGIDPDPRISEWLGFVLMLPLGFGISFQLPLVMLFLERIGIFDIQAYLSKWRVAILVIFVLAMFLTPADPYSMILMAVPLTVLYFGGVLLCRYMPRSRSPYDDLDD